jgi:hypothetical protein
MIAIAFPLSATRLNFFAHLAPSIFNAFPIINLQIPLPATPFFSHRYKGPGCRPYFTSRTSNSFASYYIHVNPAVSCNYALFCAMAVRYPSHFQSFPHSFYRHGGGTLYPERTHEGPHYPYQRSFFVSSFLAAHRRLLRKPPTTRCPLPTTPAHYPLFFGNSFHSIPSTV